MGLINSDMVANFAGVTTASLQAETGTSILIKDILIRSVADGHVSCRIDRQTVGYFRVDDADLGNVLHYPTEDEHKQTLLGLLWDKGIFKGYPVAEGETFELSGLGATAIYATIIYDEYDGPDIKNTAPNGSKSDTYFFISAGTSGASVDTAGDNLLDTPITPAEFPAFPFGTSVPAKWEVTIHGILGSERSADDGAALANYIHSTFLKLIKDRTVLFDEERNGVKILGTNVAANGTFEAANYEGLIGEYSDLVKRPPLFFTNPLTFVGGEELDVYLITEVAATAGTLLASEQEFGFILTVKKTG